MQDSDFSISLTLVGVLVTFTWWYGACIAWRRKRWMLTIGTLGAGLAAIVFTCTSSGIPIPTWLVDGASVLRAPIAFLLVGSFLANQPRWHVPRPPRWTP